MAATRLVDRRCSSRRFSPAPKPRSRPASKSPTRSSSRSGSSTAASSPPSPTSSPPTPARGLSRVRRASCVRSRVATSTRPPAAVTTAARPPCGRSTCPTTRAGCALSCGSRSRAVRKSLGGVTNPEPARRQPVGVRDRHPPVAPERARRDLHARRLLAALVLGPVHEREHLVDRVLGEAGEQERLAVGVLLDVGLENRVQRRVGGQRGGVLLIGPQLGARP